ncbi:hypothetical protein GQ43DRAFT_410110 [Delitschia confertaspora ATCC 74209]|uniref:Uncharacterized protein n=1 Tax=Delitschia confertaspora ATCC 74209 TaxID=1513339 RepID=A0A9P4JVT0_9PLEO|nr:hypothetical protein GQ43DRAFT_410110 [Delitschia confertaspora ATCC 74209]
MAQAVAKYAAKKLLNKEMNKYKSKKVEGEYDPLYEEIPHPRKPDKKKKVKKQIPAYIPPEDAEILAYARRRAYKLDMCLFNIGGLRFGWSSVIGIIPAAGDAIDGLMALLLVQKMSKVKCGLGSKYWVMLAFVLWDLVIGFVPFVGDLLDAWCKCNTRNVRILEEVLDKAYKPKELKERDDRLTEAWKNDKDHNPPPPKPATVLEEFSDSDDERLPYHNQDTGVQHGVAPPQPARTQSRQPDVQIGIDRNGDSYLHQPRR